MVPASHPDVSRAIRALLLAVVLAGLFGCPPAHCQEEEPSSASGEEITYLLEDFEAYTPGLWQGRAEAQGRCSEERELTHSSSRAAALAWDFSRCPDAGMSFVNATFHRELVGRPQAVRLWLHAPGGERPIPLAVWVSDASGEIYLARLVVEGAGWRQITCPVGGQSPAWPSGDQNGRQDPPLRLFGLAVEYGGPVQGRLIVDDLEVVTRALPREALLATVASTAAHDLFWEKQPELLLGVRNYGSLAAAGLRFTLRLIDDYHDREIGRQEVELESVPAQGEATARVHVAVPYGVHRLEWALADEQGTIRQDTALVARFLPPCLNDPLDPLLPYLRAVSPFGGVFWQATPEQGRAGGARWIRNWVDWRELEPEPGRYNLAPAVERARSFLRAGVESVWLMTLYGQPSFRRTDWLSFAPAYGALMGRLAEATRGLVGRFELGNEDNGPTRFLYTEVARHGAAAIRAANPTALIANSGTAYVDLGWLRLQAGRGLFDWLDALCVHPYTTSEAPETWGVFEQAQQVAELADELGGMKQIWTTEFGWPNEVGQRNRADWIPRHFLVGVAGGYQLHGLYAWDGHFGIYDNGRPYPAAASVHTMAKLLEGHRFAGVLERSNQAWVVVWERFGEPVVVAWSPAHEQGYSLEVGRLPVEVCDLFGNPLALPVTEGKLTLHLTSGPQYVLGASASLTEAAWAAQLEALRDRLARHLATTPLNNDEALNAAVRAIPLQPAALQKVLERTAAWAPTPAVRGIQANLLRILLLLARMGRVGSTGDDVTVVRRFRSAAMAALQRAHTQDLDLPALRWALHEFDTLDLERRAAQASRRADFAGRLTTAQAILARFATAHLMGRRAQRFTAIWPYLYATQEAQEGEPVLRERLRFVPGVPTEVKVRAVSYARHDYRATVSLHVPEGWQVAPGRQQVPIPAGGEAETSFRVSCSGETNSPVSIRACLEVPDRPLVEVTFDDLEIVPAIQVEAALVEGLLPATPLRLTLANRDPLPISGRICLLMGDPPLPVGLAEFGAVPPGGAIPIEVSLDATGAPAYHEWTLLARIDLADGRSTRQVVRPDFACAVRAGPPPAIDGDLSDWADAAPLHLDREEYGKGSFAGNWSPDDLSAVTYVKWDDVHLYFAARVTDQTFHQAMQGEPIWNQDSIQIALAQDGDPASRTELGLALTPVGEQVFRYTAPAGLVPQARLKVVAAPGRTIYEAAIPWSSFPGLTVPAAGARLRWAVLVNDDDVIAGRRFLERFEGGIAHDKEITRFGRLRLLGGGGAPAVALPPTPPDLLLREDFEIYPDGAEPALWQRVVHQTPAPEGVVRAGAGRKGSKALVFRNAVGRKPSVYLLFVREIEGVEPGADYELRCWVRGRGVAETGDLIGVCSDLWGNEAFQYATGWQASEQWQEIVLPFRVPVGGRYHVILRNLVAIEELAIDDLEVKRAGGWISHEEHP